MKNYFKRPCEKIGVLRKNLPEHGFGPSLRAKRLQQIIMFCAGCLLFSLIFRLSESYSLQLVLGLASLVPAWILIKNRKIEVGGTVLLICMSIFMLGFMWAEEGVRDEATFLFPLIMVVSLYVGHSVISTILAGIFFLNVLTIGVLNDYGYIAHLASGNSTSSSINITLILAVFCFSLFLVVRDFFKACCELQNEYERARQRQLEVEHLTNYDPLTNLPNHTLARERFKQALKRSRRNNQSLCMMFLDIDNFKNINNSLGREIGDVYLRQIADRLRDCLKEDDTLCRVGGDEFLVILEGVNDRASVSNISHLINESIKKPVVINEQQIISKFSMGVAFVPEDGNDFDSLCRHADIALSQIKDSEENRICFFDKEMAAEVSRSFSLLSDLHQALERNQLELYFQPQIDLKNHQITSAEALLRWNHPSLGVILPQDFINLAERSGLINEIGAWIIEQACKKHAQWSKLPYYELEKIAVNVSPVQLFKDNFADILAEKLEKYQLDGSALEIEITESVFVGNEPTLIDQIETIGDLGVEISIDDFGTEYSNLAYLKKFCINNLKIDRSFTVDLLHDPEDFTIIESVLRMARGLQIKTIAEGIEDSETANMLGIIGCDYGQGFYWSNALPENEFLEFIRFFKDNPKQQHSAA